MSRRGVIKTQTFTVFKDPADNSSDTQLASDRRNAHRNQNTSTTCAVLQELSTNKGFILSPKSQVMAEKENFDSTHMKLVCHSRGATCNAAPLTEKVPILGYVYKTPVQGPVPDNDMLIRAPREKAVAGNCATSELSGRLPSLTPTHRILRRGSNDNIGMRSAGDDRSDSSVAKLRPRRQTVGDRAKYDVDDLVMLLDQMALQRLEARSNKSTGLISTEPDIIAADRQIETLPYKLRVPPPLSLNAKPNIYQLDNSSSVSGGYEQHTQIERKPRKRTKESRPQNKDKLSIAVSTPPDLRQYIR